jgi:hypothetical protein
VSGEQVALPAQRLLIKRVSVKNVRGIGEKTIDLGQVTVVEVNNAGGKSSLMAGLRCVLGIDRTSLANLATITDKETGARAEDVEMVVHLEGPDGVEMRVSRRGKAQPKVQLKDGEDWKEQPRPIEFLRDLIDPEGANPQGLMAMKQDELATVVLEAMPLPDYSRSQALAIAGMPAVPISLRFPPGLHPLDEIALIEAHVTETRRATGNQRDLEKGQHEKLLKDLPADQPEHPGEELKRVAAQRDELHQEVAAALATVEQRLKARKDEIQSKHAVKLAALRADHDRAVAALAEDARQAAVLAASEAQGQAAEVKAQEEDLAAYDQRLATLRERDKGWESDRRVRALASEAKAKGEEYSARYVELTEALRALNGYKVKLVEKLPVRGLDVRIDDKGKKLLLADGVPWEEVNKARQLEVCTEIAGVRAKEPENGRPYCPVVLIDDGERFDADTRRAVLKDVQARGGQVLMAVAVATPWRTLVDAEATS